MHWRSPSRSRWFPSGPTRDHTSERIQGARTLLWSGGSRTSGWWGENNSLGGLSVCYQSGLPLSEGMGGRRGARTNPTQEELPIPGEPVTLAQSNFSGNGGAVGASPHHPQVLTPPFTKTFG